MKNKETSLVENESFLFCFLGFSVLVSRVLVHIEKNKSLVIRGQKRMRQENGSPHTTNDSFFKI